ncbi:MAG: hydantoinase/oxoprolinase N-terminal domain-containing protein [Pseudomonadota bacterium]
MRRIGIDVGGTNTDAVLLAEGGVIAAVKTPTTEDPTDGILDALAKLRATGVLDTTSVDAVMIGTTHFINAVVQRRDLTKVGALRLALPASASLPPFCDWPEDLAAIANGGVWMVEGGHDYDGRMFMPLDRAGVRRAAEEMAERGLEAVAITAAFSPLDARHEEEARSIVAEVLPDASITLSSDLGRIGLLERENVALMNAAVTRLAGATICAFTHALEGSGISAPLFITQNDGTVADAAMAARFPVYAFASGATNSMRGAAYLSGIDDAMVVDVGGTTTDVGELRHGFPREANTVVRIGGVRTLFRMPDLLSIGLGGGSHVDLATAKVGPLSVGYRLTREARVFGGERLTATDIGVASGLLHLGDRARVEELPPDRVRAVRDEIALMLAESIDRMKTEAGEVTLIAVGGGSFLVPDRLEGVQQIVQVPHGDCANAVGAAIAQVSGEVDRIFRDLSRDDAVAEAVRLATAAAVDAGAAPDAVRIVDIEDMPLAYLPGNALRVRVRAIGDIASPSGG